jgi:hypothetical protein
LEYPSLYSAIKEYYFDIKFYEVHKDASCLKNAFIKSQIVMETFFTIVHNNFAKHYKEVLKNQDNNGRYFKVKRDEIKAKIKSINNNAITPEEKYPSSWRHQEFKGIDGALNTPSSSSLRALFIASVMASFNNNENPIFKILKEKNNFSICIENIAESRNKVGHKYTEVADCEIDQYFDDVLIMQKDIKEIIEVFLKN